MHVPRVYADTSVFGGVFDEEFAKPSAAFFDMVRDGRLDLVVGPIVDREVRVAPARVRELLDEMLALAAKAGSPDDAYSLHERYIAAGVVGGGSATDALHVALATVSGCALIVSWSFRHIVNYRRIPLYNAVNVAAGYSPIAIHSPPEVVADEQGV